MHPDSVLAHVLHGTIRPLRATSATFISILLAVAVSDGSNLLTANVAIRHVHAVLSHSYPAIMTLPPV